MSEQQLIFESYLSRVPLKYKEQLLSCLHVQKTRNGKFTLDINASTVRSLIHWNLVEEISTDAWKIPEKNIQIIKMTSLHQQLPYNPKFYVCFFRYDKVDQIEMSGGDIEYIQQMLLTLLIKLDEMKKSLDNSHGLSLDI